MSAARSIPGSARVSRVGDSESFRESRTFLEAQPTDGAHYFRQRLPHFEKPWAIYAVTIGIKKDRCLSPKARTIVLNSLRHFHNLRYELFAACVMPDHATPASKVRFGATPKPARATRALPGGARHD